MVRTWRNSERQWEAEAKLFLCLVSTYIAQKTIYKRGEAFKRLIDYNYVTIYLPYGTQCTRANSRREVWVRHQTIEMAVGRHEVFRN